MKKIFIFLVVISVVCTAISFHLKTRQEKARNLILDAFQGDLISVKNDVEQNAPLDWELYIQDQDRQYRGVWFNALHAAASSGNEDVILFLLEEGLDINAPTSDKGWTPLMIAARDGHAEAAKLLIYKGADLNVKSKLGATALSFAVTQSFPSKEEQISLIVYLLKRGADPNLKDNFGHTALYYAQHTGKKEIEVLLQTTNEDF